MKIIIVFIGLFSVVFTSFAQDFQKSAGIKFPVSNVEKATSNLKEIDYKKAIEMRTNLLIESFPTTERNRNLIATDAHALISALHISFAQHRPIVISPDMVWLLIMQGVGTHIQENRDLLQELVVNFEEKKKIIVRNDEFIKGSENNDWESVFPQFSDSINTYLNDSLRNLFIPSFSTTTKIEKNAFEVALMSAVDGYFSYTVETFCGIPEITLEGTTEDWKWIADNCPKLNKIGLSDWTENLQPILNEFVNASQGNIDTIFWQSMYKWFSISGGPLITGWIIKFFSYIYKNGTLVTNPFINGNTYAYSGLKSNNFPSGLSKTDLRWLIRKKGIDDIFEMELYSGFMGIVQDTISKALKPEISWAISDKKSKALDISNNHILTDSNDVNITNYDLEKRYKRINKKFSLLDTLHLVDDSNSIWIGYGKIYFYNLKELKKVDSNKFDIPIIFPLSSNELENDIDKLNSYISEKINKKINFKGKIEFTITWSGCIDDVKMIKSNKAEYNDKIALIIKEIKGCMPGIYMGKLSNVVLQIDLNIK